MINRFAKLKTENGVTFIEVLVSLMILAVVLGGNAALYAKINIFTGELKEQSLVNHGLNERMEEIRDLPYGTIVSLPSTCSTAGFSDLDNVTCLLALDVPFSDDEGRKVTITVTWDTPQGRTLSKSMSALFTRDGLNQQ